MVISGTYRILYFSVIWTNGVGVSVEVLKLRKLCLSMLPKTYVFMEKKENFSMKEIYLRKYCQNLWYIG
jgi:hypothetical protein